MKFPKRFFEQVVGDALEAGDYDVEVRCLGTGLDLGPGWPKQFWFPTVKQFERNWTEIQRRNDLHYDIHFTVVARKREFRGKKEHPLPDPVVVCCVWADLDVGDDKPFATEKAAAKCIQECEIRPNIIVRSGRGVHAYWLTETREVPNDRLERLLRCIAQKLHGDRAAARPGRLMRVPNTINWKYGKHGKKVRIVYMSEDRYKFKDLERKWEAKEAEDHGSGQHHHGRGKFASFFAEHLKQFTIRGTEATALCPFHHDRHPSFSVNLENGLWICHAERCRLKGNILHFCARMRISLPAEFKGVVSELRTDKKRYHPELDERALYGLAGDFVRLVAPNSEADPAALLIQLLVAVGNWVGPHRYYKVEATDHHANLFALIVGASSKARKGTALEHVKKLLSRIDPHWADEQIVTGLSSGEGLIWAVRDYIPDQDDKKRKESSTNPVKLFDKRLLVIEPEFSSVLRTQRREGNRLSAIIRTAWDSGKLEILTKNSPIKVRGAHVSIIAHITTHELRRELSYTDQANGFANRFLIAYAQRSQLLPFGGKVDEEELDKLAGRLKRVRQFAREIGQVRFSKRARKLWRKVYEQLSKEKAGMLGDITSRGEAQVARLSLVYALLGRSSEIKTHHLRAGVAVWSYCEESAALIFGRSLGDPVADKILRELEGHADGLTRDDIRELFHRNLEKARTDDALALLEESGLATHHKESTGGRRAQRWVVVIPGGTR